MKQWIFKIAKKDKDTLGSIRCSPSMTAAVDKDWIWLKGHFPSGKPIVEIFQLPLIATFILGNKNQLFPQGALTPVGQLPELEWRSLPELLPFEVPPAAMPGKLTERHQIELVPSEEERPGDALLVDWATWKNYVIEAPAVRLKPLQFAVTENKMVLVLGQPLPAIPGKEFWLQHHNLLPCGFDFKIAIVAELLAHKLNRDRDAYLRFDAFGQWQKIDINNFVKANRGAVCLTDQYLI